MNIFTTIDSRRLLTAFVLALSLFLLPGCSRDLEVNDQVTGKAWIDFSTDALSFTDQGGSQEVTIRLDDSFAGTPINVSVADNGLKWCRAEVEGTTIRVTITAEATDCDRTTMLIVTGGMQRSELAVTQYARVIESYDDRSIEIVSAEATSEAEGHGVADSYDGADQTFYMSDPSDGLPVTIEYTLAEAAPISYAVYYPRMDDGDRAGAFGEFEVWIRNGGQWTKTGDYDNAGHTQRALKINMPKSATDVDGVRFVVRSALGDCASASRIGFYESAEERMDLTDIFTDATYSELREGIDDSHIGRMVDPFFRKIASGMFDGSYSTRYRVMDARPYQHPSVRSKLNKHGAYSLRDNLTGIYVEKGEDMMIYVGDTKGQTISMIIQDLETTSFGGARYTLKEGLNTVKAANKGLVYIENFTDDDIPLLLETDEAQRLAAAKTVRIHFVNGVENGYFDATDPEQDQAYWISLLRNAKSQDIDAVGKYVHITWNVADYLKGSANGSTPTEIRRTIAYFDSLVYWEWDFMGHVKYNTAPRNRHYFRANYTSGAAASAANNTWYRRNASNWRYYSQIFCEPSAFASRYWGPAHEVGHTHQTTGLKWAGMTEVTNNIQSQYVGYKLAGNVPSATMYNNAKKFLTDRGDPFTVYSSDSERDCRLVAFWQLYIYLSQVRGYADFYKDLYQHYRETANVDVSGEITTGAQQLDFVRQTCRLANLDLLDFFEKRGFLKAVDPKVVINDYGKKDFRITQAQIDALVAEIEAAGYPKPTRASGEVITDLHLITDSNKDNYK